MMYVAGVDPGSEKCGIALLDVNGSILDKKVVVRSDLISSLSTWSRQYVPLTIVIGDRTGFNLVAEEIKGSEWAGQLSKVVPVDEHLTTLQARKRYFAEHGSRGLKRLIPTTMQLPPVPYDDYVAVILAERYLASLS